MSDSYMFTPTTKITLYRTCMSTSCRVSCVSCVIVGTDASAITAAYAQSKLAVVAFTNELALRLEGMNVVANAVHPGAVATGAAEPAPLPPANTD